MIAALLGAAAATLLSAAPPTSGSTADAPTALERSCHAVVEKALKLGAPERTSVVVYVTAPDSSELGRAVQTTLLSQLAAAKFKAALPSKATSPESAELDARVLGADWLLRVTARIDKADFSLTGDAVPAWVNFWAGRSSQRAPGGEALAVRELADAEALLLAHVTPQVEAVVNPPATTSPLRFGVRPLGKLNEHVLAMAAGDLDGDGVPELAVLTPTAALVLKPDGRVVAKREHGNLPRAPISPRDPAGTMAIGEWGDRPGLKLGYFFFGAAKGEVLQLVNGALESVGALDQAPLPGGTLGLLVGSPAPGRNVLTRDVKTRLGRPLPLTLEPLSIAAASKGSPALLAVDASGAAQLFTEELGVSAQPLPPLGAGAALADLDGDGVPELVGSLLVRSDDRVRVFKLDGRSQTPIFESESMPGAFVAGAAADLDADAKEEAVLAAWMPDGSTSLFAVGVEK